MITASLRFLDQLPFYCCMTICQGNRAGSWRILDIMSAPTIDPIMGIAEQMLKRYESQLPRPRKWATPGALACALDPATIQTPALELIDRELVKLADSPTVNKLIITMPPQEGKSVRVSHRFPEWLLEHNPDLRIAIISYTDEMARRHGSDIKQDVEQFNGDEGTIDLGLQLRADSRAAGRWHVKGRRGGVYCVGVGGSLTGKPVDVMIIDDPIKNMEQAQSETHRKKIKDFWQAVCIPRNAKKHVVIQTRWHEDDLAGWLQRNEPGQWRVVNIPAQSEGWGDPLGRKPGEFMTSAMEAEKGPRNWAQIKRDVGSYVWAALYQGCPAPAAGGLFKRHTLRYWAPLRADTARHGLMNGARVDLGGRVVYLDDCWRFIAVDLAASTKTSADWTVAGAFAISPDGDLILLGGERQRLGEQDHWKMVAPIRDRYNADVVFVESRMFGTTMVIEATKAGIQVQELKADTDKVTRAIPATVRAENGRLWLPTVDTMSGIETWISELISFPNATHDDCVDVIAYAARVVAAHWLGQADTRSRDQLSSHRIQDEMNIGHAFQSATGVIPNGMNFGNTRW